MSERVAVVTSVYGGYDGLQIPPSQTVDAEWVVVTDEKIDDTEIWGWRQVVEPRPGVHPRLAAKVAKCHPWTYADADVYVWMDASCRLLRPDALEWLLRQSASFQITQFKHPWRDCVYDEAEASAPLPKYAGLPVLEQVENYRKRGHPEHSGLWATGLIVYRLPDYEHVLDVHGHKWLTEQLRWTYQDQLSQPVILEDIGLRPRSLRMPDGTVAPLHGSGYLEWANHRSEL